MNLLLRITGLFQHRFDPKVAIEQPAVPAGKTPDDPVAFSFAITGVLFVTGSVSGSIYFFDDVLDFDLAPGEEVELVAGGPLDPAGLIRARPDLGATVKGVAMQATVEGEPILRLYEARPADAQMVRERPIVSGRTSLRASSDEGVSALALVLRGTGRIAFTSFQVSRPPASGGEPDAGAPPDPLLDLVWPDYLAARKAGAEIPPPPLVSGL